MRVGEHEIRPVPATKEWRASVTTKCRRSLAAPTFCVGVPATRSEEESLLLRDSGDFSFMAGN